MKLVQQLKTTTVTANAACPLTNALWKNTIVFGFHYSKKTSYLKSNFGGEKAHLNLLCRKTDNQQGSKTNIFPNAMVSSCMTTHMSQVIKLPRTPPNFLVGFYVVLISLP